MNVILCIDNHKGLLFHNRRQSRDEKVIEKIKGIVGQQELYVNEFSHALFEGFCITVQEPLQCAKEGTYCFVENVDIASSLDRIEQLYIFKWNRDYPHDFSLKVDYQKLFELVYTEDFKGKSHEKITMEVWRKCTE